MTEPGFRIDSVKQAEPFRQRAVHPGYQVFDDGEASVLVEPLTAHDLRSAAGRASPYETGGLLAGRALTDSAGPYVLICGHVEAAPGAGRAAAFQITPQENAKLREESARLHPTADVVGWWHSHSRPSGYSQTDRETQALFSRADSVGLLIFADGEPWASAYLGPGARLLGDPVGVVPPAHGTTPTEMPPARTGRDNGKDSPRIQPGQPARRRPAQFLPGHDQAARRDRGRLRLAIIIGSAVLILLVVALRLGFSDVTSQLGAAQNALSGQIATGQHQLARQLQRYAPTAARTVTSPALSADCVMAPAAITCTARASRPGGTVRWTVNGKYAGSGSSRVFPAPRGAGQVYRVRASLVIGAATVTSPLLVLSRS